MKGTDGLRGEGEEGGGGGRGMGGGFRGDARGEGGVGGHLIALDCRLMLVFTLVLIAFLPGWHRHHCAVWSVAIACRKFIVGTQLHGLLHAFGAVPATSCVHCQPRVFALQSLLKGLHRQQTSFLFVFLLCSGIHLTVGRLFTCLVGIFIRTF